MLVNWGNANALVGPAAPWTNLPWRRRGRTAWVSTLRRVDRLHGRDRHAAAGRPMVVAVPARSRRWATRPFRRRGDQDHRHAHQGGVARGGHRRQGGEVRGDRQGLGDDPSPDGHGARFITTDADHRAGVLRRRWARPSTNLQQHDRGRRHRPTTRSTRSPTAGPARPPIARDGADFVNLHATLSPVRRAGAGDRRGRRGRDEAAGGGG